MTIQAQYVPDFYPGNGSITAFPITFNYLDNENNIIVRLRDDSTGFKTLQVLGVDYTISPETVNMVIPPAVGETLLIELTLDYLQQSDYIENDSLPAETVETDFDKRTLEAQLNRDGIERSINVDVDVDLEGFDTTIQGNIIPNKALIANSSGTALIFGGVFPVDAPVDDGTFYVGDGTNIVGEIGDVARTSMGVGSGDSPQFLAVNIGNPTDTTITRVSAGRIAVEGDNVVTENSTDILTNKTIDANGVGNSISNIEVEDLADGIAGQLITWDNLGVPAVVATGTANQVLTSQGAGNAPLFITQPPSGADVTLASVGTGQSIVSDGVGPDLAVRSLEAGTGLSLAESAGTITFTNEDKGSDLSLTSPSNNVDIGGTYPNITLDVGLTTATNSLVINYAVPGNYGDQAVAVGSSAGFIGQGNNTVSVGYLSGSSGVNRQSSTAVGYAAGAINQGVNCVAVGATSGTNNQGLQAVAVGVNSGSINQGMNAVAVGTSAGLTNQGAGSVAVGRQAGNSSQGTECIAIGNQSGETNQGQNCVAVGTGAGSTSQGIQAVAIGFGSGTSNQGSDSIAVGTGAGNVSQGIFCVAVGFEAGETLQGNQCIAVGRHAGQTNQGTNSIAIGDTCAMVNLAPSAIAIGSACAAPTVNGRLAFGNAMEAVTAISTTDLSQQGYLTLEWNGTEYRLPVYSNTTDKLIGSDLALSSPSNNVRIGGTYPNFTLDVGTTTGLNAIAINNAAIGDYGNASVTLGQGAGFVGQGDNTVSIGHQAGNNSTGLRSNTVAVGYRAGNANQSGSSVAVGYQAGQSDQGSTSVAVGFMAGLSSQGIQSVAIGGEAGETSQGNTCVAIGYRASQGNQGVRAVSIGYRAGATSQGTDSVCIGYQSGVSTTATRSVCIGSGCSSTTTAGRLCFGSGMESVTPIADTAYSQSGYLTLEWNDVAYRLPVFSSTTDTDIVTQVANSKSYGSFYQSGFTPQTEAMLAGTWKLLSTGSFIAPPLSNFTAIGTRLTYVGTDTLTFSVTYNLSSLTDSTSRTRIGIYKNGVLEQDGVAQSRNMDDAGAFSQMPMSVTRHVSLSTNDYIEPYIWSALAINFDYIGCAINIAQI